MIPARRSRAPTLTALLARRARIISVSEKSGNVVLQEPVSSPITPFEDSKEALRARFAEERRRREDADIEIVVLAGESEEQLRSTHGRYFDQVHDLLVKMHG